MAKGFGQTQSERVIQVESMVSGRNGEPLVKLVWGRESGLLTPAEARAHALSILEAAASAEIDAVVVKWADKELGMGLEQAAYLRRLFRQKRETDELPGCTLNFDGDRLCSAESGSNTPDFILAEYLVDCLNAFDKAIKARTAWYTDDEPGILAAGALADAGLLNQEGDRP